MSLWVLQQEWQLDAEPKEKTREDVITLPFKGLEAYESATQQRGVKELLRAENPDWPPETLNREAERIWKKLSGLQAQDIVVVADRQKEKVMFAESLSPIFFDKKIGGYIIRVRWYFPAVVFSRFGKLKSYFTQKEMFFEITDGPERTKLRDRMPVRTNRFARWKWVVIAIFGTNFLFMMVKRFF